MAAHTDSPTATTIPLDPVDTQATVLGSMTAQEIDEKAIIAHEDQDSEEKAKEVDEEGQTNVVTLPFRQLWIIFLGLTLAIFLASLDQTIVSTAMPVIATEFHDMANIAWIATSYLLTSTAFSPLYGSFSDIFGRKVVMLFALGTFLVGSALCGAAQDMIQIIIFRAIAGLGGGGLISMVMIILADVISLRDRGKYDGIIGAVFAVSSVIGPLLGGVFTDKVTWRWAFYINLPIGLITVLVVIFLLKLPSPTGSLREKLKRVDYAGTFFLVAGIILILLATNWGGSKYPWNSGSIIGLYVGGGIFIILFILVEGYFAVQPVMPLRLFRIRNVTVCFLCNIFIGMVFFAQIFFMPLYYQVVKGSTATASGLNLLPLVGGLIVFAMGSGLGVTITGSYRWFVILGCVLLTVGSGLLSMVDETTAPGAIIGYLFIIGSGVGFTMQTSLIASQAAVPMKDIAVVTALCNFFRTIGGVVGLAFLSALYNERVMTELTSRLADIPQATADIFTQILMDTTTIHTLEPLFKDPAIASYVSAIKLVNLICIPLSAVAFIIACFMQHIPIKAGAKPVMME